jgi:hypothetical protein
MSVVWLVMLLLIIVLTGLEFDQKTNLDLDKVDRQSGSFSSLSGESLSDYRIGICG